MTVPSEALPRKVHVGSGTGPYPITFQFADKDDVVVTWYDSNGVPTTLTITTDYSISDPPSSEVTTVASYTANDEIVLTRATPKTQEDDYVRNRTYSADVLEGGLDKLTLIMQEISEVVSRAPAAPGNAPAGFDSTLPPISGGAAIGYNQAGDGFGIVSDLTQQVNSYWEGVLATDSAAAALAFFGWLSTANEWTRQQNFDSQALSISTGAIAWNWETQQVATVSLTESATLSAPTNLNAGSCARLTITNTGAYTISWNAIYDFGQEPDSEIASGNGEVLIVDFFSPDGSTVVAREYFKS